MRNDVGVVEVVGQHERERHQPPQSLAVLLAGDGERADVGEATRDQVRGGGPEYLVAVEVEQLYASRGGVGLTSATCSRTVRTEPANPRARTMSYSRVARSFGYR